MEALQVVITKSAPNGVPCVQQNSAEDALESAAARLAAQPSAQARRPATYNTFLTLRLPKGLPRAGRVAASVVSIFGSTDCLSMWLAARAAQVWDFLNHFLFYFFP